MKYTLNQSLTLTHSNSLRWFTLTPLASLALRSRYALAPRTRSPHAIAPLALRARFARARCLPRAANAAIIPTALRRQMPPSPHPFGVFAFRESFSQAPITHTYSLTQFTLTQLAPLALRARATHALRSRYALAPRTSAHKATRRASHAPPLVGAYYPAMLPSSGLALARPEWVTVLRPYVVSLCRHGACFASCRLALARLSSRSAGLVVQPRSCLRASLPLAQPCRPAAHKATRLPYRARAISRANAPQATHPLADGAASRQRTRQPDSAQGNPTAHAIAPLGCLHCAVTICSLRSQGVIAPLRQPSQASAINPAAHRGSQTP